MKEFVLRNKNPLIALGTLASLLMLIAVIILSVHYTWAMVVVLTFLSLLLVVGVVVFVYFAIFMPIKTIIDTERNHKKGTQN